MLGKEGAMACTVAVETVIGEHYDRSVYFSMVLIVMTYESLHVQAMRVT